MASHGLISSPTATPPVASAQTLNMSQSSNMSASSFAQLPPPQPGLQGHQPQQPRLMVSDIVSMFEGMSVSSMPPHNNTSPQNPAAVTSGDEFSLMSSSSSISKSMLGGTGGGPTTTTPSGGLPPGATLVYLPPNASMTSLPTGATTTTQPGTPSSPLHSTFEENFNVLSEDKQSMLSIPRDVIDPTVGSQKYLQQGSSACYTFRFQLCRGYYHGKCVHRHQCAFIHSRHVVNAAYAPRVTLTQVHRNTPVASLASAIYARHPEGVTLLVYDAAQSKNLLIDSGMLYVTHGSAAGWRAALADRQRQAMPGDQDGSFNSMPTAAVTQSSGSGGNDSTQDALKLNNMELSGSHLAGMDNLSSSVRLQFCLHFDKSLCARGESCNFVHRVVLEGHVPTFQQHSAAAGLFAAPAPQMSHLPNTQQVAPSPFFNLVQQNAAAPQGPFYHPLSVPVARPTQGGSFLMPPFAPHPSTPMQFHASTPTQEGVPQHMMYAAPHQAQVLFAPGGFMPQPMQYGAMPPQAAMYLNSGAFMSNGWPQPQQQQQSNAPRQHNGAGQGFM